MLRIQIVLCCSTEKSWHVPHLKSSSVDFCLRMKCQQFHFRCCFLDNFVGFIAQFKKLSKSSKVQCCKKFVICRTVLWQKTFRSSLSRHFHQKAAKFGGKFHSWLFIHTAQASASDLNGLLCSMKNTTLFSPGFVRWERNANFFGRNFFLKKSRDVWVCRLDLKPPMSQVISHLEYLSGTTRIKDK